MSDYRKAQCEKMLHALERAGMSGMSRKQFADLLGIKKSQYLIGLIDELLARGLAIKTEGTNINNKNLFVYIINGAAVSAPESTEP